MELAYETQIIKDDVIFRTVKKKHFKKHRNTEMRIFSGSRSVDLFFGETGQWAWLKDQSDYKKAITIINNAFRIDTEFSSGIEFTVEQSWGSRKGLKLMNSAKDCTK